MASQVLQLVILFQIASITLLTILIYVNNDVISFRIEQESWNNEDYHHPVVKFTFYSVGENWVSGPKLFPGSYKTIYNFLIDVVILWISETAFIITCYWIDYTASWSVRPQPTIIITADILELLNINSWPEPLVFDEFWTNSVLDRDILPPFIVRDFHVEITLFI